MVAKAQAKSKQVRKVNQEKEDLTDCATAAYHAELAKPRTVPRRSARKVCKDFEQLYLEESGKKISLNYNTIIERAKGRKGRLVASQDREWLMLEEVKIVISHTIRSAQQGFPLSHRRLKEDVDAILEARLGKDFPIGGVGKCWMQRFIEKHSDQLKTSWSTPLESKCANAVNPHTDAAYFDLLGGTIEEHSIKPHNIYGVDEVGCQPYGMDRERVIGGIQPGPQYQQRTGNKENITVLVTICADGSALTPAVIFKGKGYQVKWAQNNPANASIGYSKKGWTDNEIGVDWLKLFDAETSAKAGGEARLLLVDGHTSHYSRAFLNYAWGHNILVLCYPSHTTHVYQGLDVVIFAVLKRRLSYERDQFVRKNAAEITKENFLEIYGKAHLDALTLENVKAAFRKTGVHPFNRDVVTPAMMAPSQPGSMQSNLPAPPPTPMKIIVKLLKNLAVEDDTCFQDIDELDEDDPPPSPSEAQKARQKEIVQDAVRELAKTNMGYLIGMKDAKSNAPMFHAPNHPVLPTSGNLKSLLTLTAKTTNEALLLAALQELQADNLVLKQCVIEMQASNILNEAYCTKLAYQLALKEKKHAKKGQAKGKLMGDGLPRMLSGDEFYQKVVEFAEWQEEEVVRRAAKVDIRVTWQAAVVEWAADEVVRKEKNALQAEQHKDAMKIWTAEKTEAKEQKIPFKVAKPPREPALKAALKPKLKDFEAAAARDGSGGSNDGSDNENEQDSDEG